MDYETLDAVIQQLIAEAGQEHLHAFGAETIVRLAQDAMQPGLVTKWDLDEKGRLALADACQHVLTASPSELRRLWTRIDEGVLTDGDMDFPLCNIMEALERWITFQETGRRSDLYELAIRSIDRVDFHLEESDISDMLAAPEMAAEFERIRQALTG